MWESVEKSDVKSGVMAEFGKQKRNTYHDLHPLFTRAENIKLV